MFQKVPESTPNMRGFAPFWFRQARGHSLHYNTQDVRFPASFKEISKQLDKRNCLLECPEHNVT